MNLKLRTGGQHLQNSAKCRESAGSDEMAQDTRLVNVLGLLYIPGVSDKHLIGARAEILDVASRLHELIPGWKAT